MKTLMPGNGLTALRNEMDRLFDRIWEGEVPERTMGEWSPVLDFSETKETFVLKMEVPGIDPKDIKVSLQDHVLTITGERKREEEEKDERFYRMERSYGTFTRSIRLPMAVDEKKVNAVFKDGVLVVSVPKAEAGKGTLVPIKTA
jgi:HSP20 family protein